MEIKEQFGDFLRRLRKLRGFKTQKEFSEATGVSQASISRIEDNIQKPSKETLRIFAKVLDFSYSEFMVRAGYYDKDNLHGDTFEEIIKKPHFAHEVRVQETILSLNDEKLLDKFTLIMDGKKLSENEVKGVIAYLRALRALDDN